MTSSLAILIVEDVTITAFDIQETLEKAGHTVTAISRNFQEAVAAVKRQPPDLAIIDVRLEGSSADGITTA
ncbi:response regulator [Spirosoma flavum]|uniref:Response regulator n=1 Tax=Spirosoma flavum TaxID=2048557 RepID=A0ABW6ALM4_9BACT